MRYLFQTALCAIALCAGCATNSRDHSPAIQTHEKEKSVDLFNPLTQAEVEQVRFAIEHLQPYTRLKDFWAGFRFANRLIPTSSWEAPDG